MAAMVVFAVRVGKASRRILSGHEKSTDVIYFKKTRTCILSLPSPPPLTFTHGGLTSQVLGESDSECKLCLDHGAQMVGCRIEY